MTRLALRRTIAALGAAATAVALTVAAGDASAHTRNGAAQHVTVQHGASHQSGQMRPADWWWP